MAAIAYVGAYAPDGLHVATVGADHGLRLVAPVAAANASWLTYSPDRRFLYATNETDDGKVSAFDLADPMNPVPLNGQSSGGALPTHLSVHPTGRFLFAANFDGGSVAVFPIGDDGTLGSHVDLVRHQPGSKAHWIDTDPTGTWVLTIDLGTDSIYVYAFDPTAGTLTEHRHVVLADGSGPRHLAFHPNGRVAYVLHELRSAVTVAAWDPATGTLTPHQVVATAGADAPVNYPGELQVATDGRFVYVSNRGANTIATMATGADGTTLTPLGHTSTGGDWPRHFAIDDAEQWLYVANQRSGTVTWLPLDNATGTVGPVAGTLAVPGAATVLFSGCS